MLALLFAIMQQLTLRLLNGNESVSHSRKAGKWLRQVFSLLPSLFFLWLMGDENVLLSLPVAFTMALATALAFRRMPMWADLPAVPLIYWAIGPVVWIYVALRIAYTPLRRASIKLRVMAVVLPLWLVAVQWAAGTWLLRQWPRQMVWTGLNYYRIPMQWPDLSGYNSDKYELLKQDYLIRHEQWDKLLERASRRVVQTPFWSNSVNLALSAKGQLADKIFDYWQSGPNALLSPMVRDNMTNLPTAEAFWRLGMVNSALRYYSDLQESILNARKSGRFEKRITECLIVNGQYDVARKHLALLKKTLFYSSWAEEAEKSLGSEAAINAHPVWGKQRQKRYAQSFLYNYGEIDKMLGLLFMQDTSNKMALEYFLCQLLLKCDAQLFMQSLPLAQKHGGYEVMPMAWQDAVSCMRSRTAVDSPYGRYVKRFMAGVQK